MVKPSEMLLNVTPEEVVKILNAAGIQFKFNTVPIFRDGKPVGTIVYIQDHAGRNLAICAVEGFTERIEGMMEDANR